MQKFRTTFDIQPSEDKISIHDCILTIGSCFAENISHKLNYFSFNVVTNPFGILYNPLSIADTLEKIAAGKIFTENELHEHEHLWHTWFHHSRFSGTDKENVLTNINDSIKSAHEQFNNCDWLILTLGSSYAYFLNENNQLVNNCHKYPAANFERKLLSPEEMFEVFCKVLSDVFSKNPKLKVILTVSPVRYVRDGIPENQSSKARLIYLKDLLIERFGDKVSYFPAYELIIDDLRDYRFFNADMVHPNDTAIEYVWEKFRETYLTSKEKTLLDRIDKFRKLSSHKTFFPESLAHQALKQKIEQERRELEKLVKGFE